MKTIAACGTWFEHLDYGQSALWRWFFHYRSHAAAMGITHFVCCNDGCLSLPLDSLCRLESCSNPIIESRLTIIHHSTHLGRPALWTYPGWWRNLQTACRASLSNGFEKMFWLEYDAFVLSERMMQEMRETNSGLVCYWCPRHNLQELGISIFDRSFMEKVIPICERMITVTNSPVTQIAESVLPWTTIRKNMIGDRYGEFTDTVPPNADYACQWVSRYDIPRRS